MKILLFVVSLFTGTLAFAGATNAELDCKSADGLAVVGKIPGDFAEFEMNVKLGDKAARLYSVLNQQTTEIEENASVTVVEDLKNGVWTLVSRKNQPNTYGVLQMYALPKTVKYQALRHGHKATFTAKIYFNLDEIAVSSVEKSVSCSLKYEI